MKRLLPFLTFVLLVPPVFATSQRAYQDYLYQFDVYRQKYADFSVAKNEYLKFHTLTSQTDALAKTKAMLTQRDLLLRSYLLLLNEKLNEAVGLTVVERTLYQTLLRNEVAFLDTHSSLVSSIGSLADAEDVSKELESHYAVLQASVRQTISGLSLANLSVLAKLYDIALADAKAIVSDNRGAFAPEKQATLDRWLLQITNTRSIYQQKIDSIAAQNSQLKGTNIDEQDRLFRSIQKEVAEARQYLSEGSSYLGELVTSLKYVD